MNHRTRVTLLVLLLTGPTLLGDEQRATLAAGNQQQAAVIPPADHNLVLAAPIATWDEAVPLGNGLLGGLLWGEKNTLRLSLDRGDLWDERPASEKEWWKKHTYPMGKQLVDQKKFDTLNGLWDSPGAGVTPTKLPGGRLEITLDATQQIKTFELNLATAEGVARFTDGTRLDAFFSAAEPVALFHIPGPEPKSIQLLSPMDVLRRRGGGGSVGGLGYPAAKPGAEGGAKWYVQQAADGLVYCVCTESRRVGNETLVAVTIASTNDGADPLVLARKRCSSALAQGYATMLKPHVDWWRTFWLQSSVSVPEPAIQRHYVLCRYLYGAASRRGAPPMPLQGVWTADCGELPPWKGDYHNDLNTQMTYIAYHEAGSFDEGASYLDFLWQRKPFFEKFARDFYGTPGLACPGTMSLAGQPLGGWGQYSLSPTMSAWGAHLFYLHWRYTVDDAFLRDRAYPWCSGVGECMLALLKPDAGGVLKLPLSSSPEVYDGTGRAWLQPNSNYDLMCLRMLFLSLKEMADAYGKPVDASKWATAATALGDFHADDSGVLLLDAKTPLPYSHRHLSNIIGIYPFNLMTCEGSETDRQRIRASLAQWDTLGTRYWCGYSFSWMSCLRARIGDAESALRNMDIFVKAFILRNGFHANGDQTKSRYSEYVYRPFTLEGNFLAMQAVQEMLLQSWSPTPGRRDTEVIRIFPATPWLWHDVSFTDLRAEGGYRVSAKRENNATTWFRIVAGKNGIVRIRDNFGGRTPHWNAADVKKAGDNYEVTLKSGQSLEAIFSKPTAPPPRPM
jgi:alpha-L-fucosidase 2